MKDSKELLITREREFVSSRCHEMLLNEVENRYHVSYLPLMNFSYKAIDYDEIFSRLDKDHSEYWLLLTSANSVPALKGIDKSRCRFAAIGSSTSEALQREGYKTDFIPSVANAETFSREFYESKIREADNTPVILLQGSSSSSVMKDYLSSRCKSLLVLESYQVSRRTLNESEVSLLRRFLLSSYKSFSDSSRSDSSSSDSFNRASVVILSSLQGKFFLEECIETVKRELEIPDIDSLLQSLRVYCIGLKTADSLDEYGFPDIRVSEKQELSSIFMSLVS